MKTKVKVSQCHKFEVGMEGQHYLILFACFHGFMTLPIGRGMKKVELWNLDFLIYFKPSAFVFSATFVTCISAIEQLQHRWSLGLFSCSRIASVHLLSPERNVTPVAKELANPEDRRIEKISFRALTKHEKHEPIKTVLRHIQSFSQNGRP